MMLFPPDLQGSITRIHRTIELMYSDKSMMQVSKTLLFSPLLEYNKNKKTSHKPCAAFGSNVLQNLCRFLTDFMQCWSTRARPMPATTGLISTTLTSAAG